MTTAPEPHVGIEVSDPGRFEPSPYDLGITDDPEATWQDGRAAGSGEPVPGLEAPNGEPVYRGAGGRLVYDIEPESADGCFAEFHGGPAAEVGSEAEPEAEPW
jgi:hypothetical protein